MSGTLVLRNRQRVCPVNTRLLREITLHLLRAEFGAADFEVCVHLVAAPEMARLNWEFLRHEGSTDIITFDQSEDSPENSGIEPLNQMAPPPPSLSPATGGGEGARRADEGETHRAGVTVRLAGELFICLDDAVKQAREFRTTWQEELARYVIHGLLHLRGFDDLEPAARRVMKREENRLLRRAGRAFTLAQLQKQ
jgi:rRNA maturation RNase YbeY